MGNVLSGLHAAHEAKSDQGLPLGIVHRDVSPQNVLVGVDGVARVLDFGVAKAAMRYQSTQEGRLKGKFAYMAPSRSSSARSTDGRMCSRPPSSSGKP
jgi:eukaryotic-like serine/threonine-protein kinase